jgi:single-strand DNA-binding protein
MAATELTSSSTPPATVIAPLQGRRLVGTLASAYMTSWTLLLAGAAACQLSRGARWLGEHALAVNLHVHIHPAPAPMFAAFAGLAVSNTLVMCWQLLPAALGAHRHTITRRLVHTAVLAGFAHDLLAVAAAIGVYRARIVPYLPHWPLELYALDTGPVCWLLTSRGQITRRGVPRNLGRPAPMSKLTASGDQARRLSRRSCLPAGCRLAAFACSVRRRRPGSLQGRAAPFPSHPLGSARPPSRRKPGAVNQPEPQRREPMLNSVNLIARVATDVTSDERNGTQIAKLRVAVNRPRGKEGENRGADFIDVVVFGAQAQACASYLQTGRLIAIEGRLAHSEWQAEDGSRRQKLEVIARNVEFLDAPRHQGTTPEPAEAAA